MALPEQTNKVKDFAIYLTFGCEYFEIHPSQILHDGDKSNYLLQHAFRNLARKFFENWELSLQIFNQLESESISFLLGQCNGSEPDQLFSLTAFLHATSTKKPLFNCWVNHK
jgi:hypothetical protein